MRSSAVLMMLLVAGCETANHAEVEPDAAPCASSGTGSGSGSGSAVDVPANAPCSTYQAMIDRGEIVTVVNGYLIAVDVVPFYPLWSAEEPLANGARTIVYGPQTAGSRLGVVGRVDDSENCLWLDAVHY